MIPTKSNIISFSIGCIIALIAAHKFIPKPAPQVPAALLKQEQVANCRAIVTKRTNKDGSVDEIAEFIAANTQKQQIVVEPTKETIIIFAGFGTDLRGSINVKYGPYLHQVVTDGNKDHTYYLTYKVLEF
jgi:hypothetical protein